MYKCQECDKEFEKRQSYAAHIGSHKRGTSYKLKRQTKKSITRKERSNREKKCEFCGLLFESYQSLGGHTINCKKNPNIDSIRKNIKEKTRKKLLGRPLSEKHKKTISDSMKKAHLEKRAWNIGKSRWNNKKSYPEKFFEAVINNEFDDKNYTMEYPVDIYSIDFAWVDKKLAIEIDGSQHKRFKEIIDRDKRKDKCLNKNGWKVLRIDWKDLCNETKLNIKLAKDFIHNKYKDL